MACQPPLKGPVTEKKFRSLMDVNRDCSETVQQGGDHAQAAENIMEPRILAASDELTAQDGVALAGKDVKEMANDTSTKRDNELIAGNGMPISGKDVPMTNSNLATTMTDDKARFVDVPITTSNISMFVDVPSTITGHGARFVDVPIPKSNISTAIADDEAKFIDVPITKGNIPPIITGDGARFVELRREVLESNGTVPGVRRPRCNEQIGNLCEEEVNLFRPEQFYMLYKTLRDVTSSVRLQFTAEVENQRAGRNRLSQELVTSHRREEIFKEQLKKESAEKVKFSKKVYNQKLRYDNQTGQLRQIINSLRAYINTRLSSEKKNLQRLFAVFELRQGEADDRVAQLQNENEEMSKRAQKEVEEVTKRAQREKAELSQIHERVIVEMRQRHEEEIDEMQRKMGQLRLSLEECEGQKCALKMQQRETEQLLHQAHGEKESLAVDIFSLNSKIELQACTFSDAQKRFDEDTRHLRKHLEEKGSRSNEVKKARERQDIWVPEFTKKSCRDSRMEREVTRHDEEAEERLRQKFPITQGLI